MQLLFDSIIKGSINNRKFAKKEIIINLNLFFSFIEREINGVFLQRTKGAAIKNESNVARFLYTLSLARLYEKIFFTLQKKDYGLKINPIEK